ncbi:dual serine/threonine and tyrosine protein kinase-like [Stylophora pistillata]|uniref:dual serine/threonine and tyrosine protein kinase-like n=1 Tax=Stylophora pistillata TaxID=50429 RepID=UPI000C04B9ED|nr:dual serine/threonine and tyrosine protein kinase-like [Stylophora pistillata]XP_022785086.1 dual serine/threonine and tyrosine protein kinase-like [Stylophora pistillata]
MASLKGIFGNESTKADEFPTLSFEEQFKELTSLISFFEECSMKTWEFINGMKKELSDSLKTDLMTDTERKRLQSYAAKKSTLLVLGQTNSGKSSFVNELLGGSFMPTSEEPCTSRIVRLKYSEKNYLQVLDKSKPNEGEKIFFDGKRLPKEEIELVESRRADKSWINSTVEVGLNNSLFQNGHLEVIDAPGMSENEALDEIVEECIHGILQVIIYVIDGNSSLRLQERDFLLDLKEKIGNLPIFYLCNKVDKDRTAVEYDRDSDLEDNVDKGPHNELGKELLAYRALSLCHMVPDDIEYTQCPFFHGLSTKEVRDARQKKQSNQYTKQFDDLRFKLLKFIATGVNSHLRSAVEFLCQIQKRVFDFFLNCDLNQDTIPAQDELFSKLEIKEQEYVEEMQKFLYNNLFKFSKAVEDIVKSQRAKIVADASELQFDSIRTGDIVGQNEVVEHCRSQIKDLVLLNVTNKSIERIQPVASVFTRYLRESLEQSLSEVGEQDDNLAILVKMQLKYSFLQHFPARDICPYFDYALMKSGVRPKDNAKKAVNDVWSVIRGKGTYLNAKWKQRIAENVLDNIDCDAIARRICDKIAEDLEDGHQLLQLNLVFMRKFCRAALEVSAVQKKFAVAQSPYFSSLMSKAGALSQTLASDVPSRATVGAQIGRSGNRGRVFEDKTNEKRVVKQLTCAAHHSEMRDEHLLGITRTLRRTQDDISTILRPISLILDGSNAVSVLFPKMVTDLFEILQCDKIQLHQGLRIAQQMADALENCWDRRIYHVDLRTTNILLDFCGNARLNVSKPRDDTIPYPDNQAPFHVPAQNPGANAPDADSMMTLKNHCVYSLAVLLLLLVEEKYCRPPYAQTGKVNEVYAAVDLGEDLKYVSGLKNPKGLFSGGRKKAREIVLSMFDFHEKHNEYLLSQMNYFKFEVTGVISSFDTTVPF